MSGLGLRVTKYETLASFCCSRAAAKTGGAFVGLPWVLDGKRIWGFPKIRDTILGSHNKDSSSGVYLRAPPIYGYYHLQVMALWDPSLLSRCRAGDIYWVSVKELRLSYHNMGMQGLWFTV